MRALSSFPHEAINAAFRGWREVSPFFPAISDIRELCVFWVRRQAEIQEDQERNKRLNEIAQARTRGELLEWPDVIKKFSDIVSKESTLDLRKKAFMPAVPDPLTDAELKDRREMLRQQTEAMRKKHGRD